MADGFFVQSIQFDGAEVGIDYLKSATLTVEINAIAPVLVLRLKNPVNTLLEDLGLKVQLQSKGKGQIKLHLMDYYSPESKPVVMDFKIMDIHEDHRNNNILVCECLEIHAYHLSQKSHEVYTKSSIENIIGALTGLPVEVSIFPNNNTYHVDGKRRIDVVKQIAREMGAIFFIRDNKAYLKTKEDLFKETDQALYEYRNEGAEFKIVKPKIIDDSLKNEDEKRHHIGFHMDKGLIISSHNKDSKPMMVGCDSTLKINNLAKSLQEAVIFRAIGNYAIKIGSPIKTVYHSGIPDRPEVEYYPQRVILSKISYHSENNFSMFVNGSV